MAGLSTQKRRVWKRPRTKINYKKVNFEFPKTETVTKSLTTAYAKKYIATLAINILVIIFVLFAKSNYLPPEVPLYYGLARGNDQIVPSALLIIPSLVAIILSIINFLLSTTLKDDFLKSTLLIASIVITFFSLITTLKIVFLVGSF